MRDNFCVSFKANRLAHVRYMSGDEPAVESVLDAAHVKVKVGRHDGQAEVNPPWWRRPKAILGGVLVLVALVWLITHPPQQQQSERLEMLSTKSSSSWASSRTRDAAHDVSAGSANSGGCETKDLSCGVVALKTVAVASSSNTAAC